ncbi:MAG: hypothetical protein V3R82_02505 [Candidatus Hydrothermarchaeales archaeon]
MPTIQTTLLSLESVLLVATLILLLFSIKEGRSRDELLKKIGETTKILSREDYFTTVISAFQAAEKEVFGCITGRTPTGSDKKRIDGIVQQIERLTKSGVKVRYMLPKFPDRLGIGHLYTKAGAEVRYTNCLFLNDHRSMIVDSKLVIVGVPEAVGEVEPTKKGFRIPSEGLARILKDHYSGCWNHNISYGEYLKEVLEQTGGSVELLAKELEIDVVEISGILKKTLIDPT